MNVRQSGLPETRLFHRPPSELGIPPLGVRPNPTQTIVLTRTTRDKISLS